jgi:hypothetical protein
MTKVSKKSQTKQSCKTGVMVSADFQKYNFYNTGTPQEMIDEDNYFNPKTKEDEIVGFIASIIYLLIVFIIAYFIW